MNPRIRGILIFISVLGVILSSLSEFHSKCSACGGIHDEARYIFNLKVSWLGVMFFSVQLCGVLLNLHDILEYICTGVFVLPYFWWLEVWHWSFCFNCTCIHGLVLGGSILAFYELKKRVNPVSMFASVIIELTLLALLYIIMHKLSTPSVEFYQCICDEGWVLYGNSRCSTCIFQHQLLPTAPLFADCDAQPTVCEIVNITSQPTWAKLSHTCDVDTWNVQGIEKMHTGVLNIFELSKLTGCALIYSHAK